MDKFYREQQLRVDDVLATIALEIERLEQETQQRKHEVVHIRKHFWEEVKINLDTFDDFLETIIGLRQEAQELAVNQTTHKHAADRLAMLKRLREIPYFGRIDFKEHGESTEQVYIGVSSLMDAQGDDFLIYDWRSPIASMYYDYGLGKAQYETPDGIITGELEEKWQYIIRRGKLEAMFDTAVTIGDEVLQQVLGKGTDKQMHNIVATIQQDQNRIIRHDQGRLLIVHGAAGSGKTSAALQRIAYLLYKYREQLSANQIILFSPNHVFSSYVANILPELGEDNMQQVTFQQYLQHRLHEAYTIETPFDQLEYVLTAQNTKGYAARMTSIHRKATTAYFEALVRYSESLQRENMPFSNITFRGATIMSAQQLATQFYSSEAHLRLPNRLEKLKEWVLAQLKHIQKTEAKKEWVQQEIEYLSDAAYHQARRYLAEKRGLRREEIADYEVEPHALAQLIVHRKLAPLRKKIKQWAFIDYKKMYAQLFEQPHYLEHLLPADEFHAVADVTLQALAENKLLYEDATPYLLLQELTQGFHSNRLIKHIVIDEAQDYSAFQFEFLKRLFPAAKMTVLGDFNQAIFAHAAHSDDFTMLTQLYGEADTTVMNLHRSYRSTKPIIDFTKQFIQNGEDIIAFERDGAIPQLTTVENTQQLHAQIEQHVKYYEQAGYSSIAIICVSSEESVRAFQQLQIEGLKQLTTSSSDYEQGVVVVPSYLAKGIEFDAVIVYNAAANVYDEQMRRTFYTVCTRAMHVLQLFSVGEPTVLLPHK